MKKIIFFIFCLSLFLIFPQKALAQVVINEFSSASSSDWIELYNTSETEIDLLGWVIKDTASTPVKEFNTSSRIPANGFCGINNISSRLNNNGDRIELFDEAEREDCVSYGDGNKSFCDTVADVDAPLGGLTASRLPDGTGSWRISAPTYEYSNAASQEPSSKLVCYSPTPTPEPTEVPTATPTPTPAPTSTPTPTPLRTSTPKPTTRPMPMAAGEETDTEATDSLILGLRNELMPSSTPGANEEKNKKSFPFLALFLILGGLGCLAGTGLALYKKAKTSYNENQDGEENNPNNP